MLRMNIAMVFMTDIIVINALINNIFWSILRETLTVIEGGYHENCARNYRGMSVGTDRMFKGNRRFVDKDKGTGLKDRVCEMG